MNHFLKAIGVLGRGTGGATGNLKNIREQILRIAGSTITVESDDGVHAQGSNTQILDGWNLWFDPRDPNQGSFIESELALTEKFFKHIAESPIPIDLNVLRELTKPRSMDIYIWLTLKQYWLAKKQPRRLHLHVGNDGRKLRHQKTHQRSRLGKLPHRCQESHSRHFDCLA